MPFLKETFVYTFAPGFSWGVGWVVLAAGAGVTAGWWWARSVRACASGASSGDPWSEVDRATLLAAAFAAPVGLLLVDARGVVTHANDAAHELLGRAPRTLGGFELIELGLSIPGDAVGRSEAVVPAVAAFAHPDGSERMLELYARPVQESGAVRGYVVWIVDVTGRVRDAADLARAREQIRRSDRLETMATLAGGLAHDFNNLLAPIVGHVDLAKLDIEEGSRAHEDLDLVKSAAQRASELAGRLLRLARPERDRVEPVPLQEILREVLGLLGTTPAAPVEVVARLDPTCPPVLGTKTQMHQVLFNLCKNALQAMPGGGTLTATVDAPEALATWEVAPRARGPLVRLRITDTGHGMDEATQKRIFEPFFSTKRTGQGSGLGLSMVRGIVTSYRGTISVRSAPGRGSTFTLVFPALLPEPATTTQLDERVGAKLSAEPER